MLLFRSQSCSYLSYINLGICVVSRSRPTLSALVVWSVNEQIPGKIVAY